LHILVATGGARHSEPAIDMAGLIARFSGADVTVLCVVKHSGERPHAEKVLQSAEERLHGLVGKVHSRIRQGEPANEIVQECKTGGYNLVVMGERPDHGLRTRFRGSTREKVIGSIRCPVLVAKGQIKTIDSILLCDSGLGSASTLPNLTVRLVEALQKEVDVTILHVMSQISAAPGIPGSQLRADAEGLIKAHTPEGEFLEDDLAALAQTNIHPHAKIRHGLVVDEILAEATSGNHDLIVIGAHHEEGWRRFLLDDIAEQILVRVDRPVLVVK
jgi:nucleotide-binding universal stress UspA family protein